MSLLLVEAASFARRLARRRLVRATLALEAGILAWIALVAPVDSARAALATAQALGALTVLVLASGCVADDRAAARLVLDATHPVPRACWVGGRWLAVFAAAAAVSAISGAVLLLSGPGLRPLGGLTLATVGASGHAAALAALAVALSCGAGSTPQVLTLLGVLLFGLVPPEIAAPALTADWATPLLRVVWALLPTPWALDRVQGWALALEGPVPLLALALLVQAPLFLAAGARSLLRAELGARSP